MTAPVAVARNPSWSAAEILAEVRARPDIPTRWAPRHLELGCGKHGCVYETGDPDVVLKINLGLVQRIDGPRWVITDPGHVVMIQS